MQNDQEVYAEVINNNPFWEIYDSQFEILIPPGVAELPELEPPDIPTSTEAYISYLFIVVLAISWFIINRKHSSKILPVIYYDEKEQWYYYQSTGKESQWIKGHERWLPQNYYFDKNQGAFYFNDGANESRWVTIEELNDASLNVSESTPSALYPVLLVIIGFFVANYLFGPSNSDLYQEYLVLQEQREREQSLFDPFEGMCQLNNKNALMPQQMMVQILYDLPVGSNPPLAIGSYAYLENDVLRTPDGNFSLPVMNFISDIRVENVAENDQIIDFGDLSYGSTDCSQGNTVFEEYDPDNNTYIAYEVPINRLKSLSLGEESGLYERNLFGYYESNYLINTSSFEVRTKRYIYSDNIIDCGSDSTSATYGTAFRGVGNLSAGQIVPWDTEPPETIEVSEFQLCSSLTYLEYRAQ